MEDREAANLRGTIEAMSREDRSRLRQLLDATSVNRRDEEGSSDRRAVPSGPKP